MHASVLLKRNGTVVMRHSDLPAPPVGGVVPTSYSSDERLVRLWLITPKSAMSWRLPGRPSSISSTLRVPPSARVSTSCNTKPIHDFPAGNGPAGHIAPPHTPNLSTLPPDTPLGLGRGEE